MGNSSFRLLVPRNRSDSNTPAGVPFEKHTLDLGSAEAAAVADINGDGRLDVVAGEYCTKRQNGPNITFAISYTPITT
jgi:hypothetical protein